MRTRRTVSGPGATGTLWALADLRQRGIGSDKLSISSERRSGSMRDTSRASTTRTRRFRGFGWARPASCSSPTRLAPDAARRERLFECVLENVDNETLELMWGAPGTMLAAQAMLERTGDERWAETWKQSASIRSWCAWDPGVWSLDTASVRPRPPVLGPAHGFAGNVAALAHGGELLPEERRRELAQRATATLAATAVLENGRANGCPKLGMRATLEHRDGIRVQWCHGSPGMVGALALLLGEPRLDELLVAGAELTWEAGPLVKGPSLCHGTAGNGLLVRSRSIAARVTRNGSTAPAPSQSTRSSRSRANARPMPIGRFSLWLGDLGAAVYAVQCIDGDTRLPTCGARL